MPKQNHLVDTLLMYTKLCFLLSICCCCYLPAQTVLSGSVVDAGTGAPLHFATVAVAGQPYGTLTAEDGSFELNTPETLAPAATIVVSYLGYGAEEYTLADLAGGADIKLRPGSLGLPVVEVSSAGELTAIELGRKERKAITFYQDVFEQTYQLASRINNPEKREGVITGIRYYFGKAAKKGKPVRINFYSVDPACDCPGSPLHASSIIPGKNKSRWNKLDLTADQVVLPAGDFFVAFEWLALSLPNASALNFSIGIIPDRNAAAIYEKVGGAPWAESVKRGIYRPLVRVSGKVN
ncbi:carboxypeptidase-like regulatory domain-containing protein [Neolewinella aurantiaca]|uniref:Carboxypeptidase-like regulatory domain-containing protein n=1 Tax=Neolewinella aurantiaca TaxID=2602767 RepID=A0A5C7FC90_9BACT|nr:carboxypeptidase-like regulatory domain-containing protein [Neolewinella aurantiaca]TXF87080.1 carboxypeptidase-like regulatory domain-containing protein [Neolewinella aurantiaca]